MREMIGVEQFTLEPIDEVVGELIDDALRPGSQFQRVLSQYERGRTTITLWVYPTSFQDFRAVKHHLYPLGFAVAGRPLQEGRPIGGSVYGTRSSAQ